MEIVTQEPVKEQTVEAGLRAGIRHEVVKGLGRGEFLTGCGMQLTLREIFIMPQPKSRINCPGCLKGNDADFRTRKQRGGKYDY